MSLVHLHDAALPLALFHRLRSSVRSLGGERLRTTYQTTFWFELGAPAAVVEQAILCLRAFLPREPVAGAEWWLSRMRTNRVGVDFHQDRDEKLVRQTGTLRHPRLSSVLFLNRVQGGALAVTTQSPNARNPCCAPVPLDADLVAPRPNRLVWFDGRLTHGVLDADNQVPTGNARRAGELRLAVVMNWWRRRPTGVPRFHDVGVYAALRVAPHPRRGRSKALGG